MVSLSISSHSRNLLIINFHSSLQIDMWTLNSSSEKHYPVGKIAKKNLKELLILHSKYSAIIVKNTLLRRFCLLGKGNLCFALL